MDKANFDNNPLNTTTKTNDLQLSLLDEMEDLIYISNPETYELLFVNKGFTDAWGYNPIGEKCYKVLQNRNKPCPFCTNHYIFNEEIGKTHVWELKNEVRQRWYRCSDKAIRWHDGSLVRFELASDITKLKETEFLLKDSKEKYQMLFLSMSEGFAYHEAIYDTNKHPIDFIYLDLNPKFEEFTGLKKENVLNKKATECIPGIEKSKSNLIEKFGFIARDGGESTFEFYFEPFKSWYNISVFSPEKNFFGTTIENITEKKKSEQKIKETLEELKISNQELEQFAYVASHDLQEPLRMISSFTSLLKKNYHDTIDEKGKMYIDYATDGAFRMQNLINDLLDFSRISTRGEKSKLCNCNEILDNILANLQQTINETKTVINNKKLPNVYADQIQLGRVFQNLISNAIKFRDEKLPTINISCEEKDNEHVFCVADNGIGIDPKYKEKIFVIFQRLNNRAEYPGTGIGLAICKRIVNRHKGRIWVESEINQGSKFYFTIPKHNNDER